MRFAFLVVLIAMFSPASAAARETRSPCDLLGASAQVREVLGAIPTTVAPDDVGEETAPYCLWQVKGGERRIKLEVWSSDLAKDMTPYPDAKSLFDALLHQTLSEAGKGISDFGDSAFQSAVDMRGGATSFQITIYKPGGIGAVLILDFRNVQLVQAIEFAKAIAHHF